MKFVISATHGSEDPTLAILPWIAAGAAVNQGHEVILCLFNEAVTTAQTRNYQGVGLPKDLQTAKVDAIQSPSFQLWVCKPCAIARGITTPDVGVFVGMGDFTKAVSEADRYIGF